MSDKEERKFTYDKLSKEALARCGAGVRRLFEMTDEEIRAAKKKDLTRLEVHIKEKKAVGPKSEEDEEGSPFRPMPVILPHPFLGPVTIIDPQTPPKIRAILEFAGNSDDLLNMGIFVKSHIHDFFTIQTSKDQLMNLAAQPATQRIQLPRIFLPTLRDAGPAAEIDLVHATGTQGNGVLVGVLDSPIHVEHHAFRIPAGTNDTRIRFMWVQEPDSAAAPGDTPEDYFLDTINNPNSPNFMGLNYGRIYDEDYINAALTAGAVYGNNVGEISKLPSPPDIFGNQHYEHGTHVTGIAAGSGHLQNWAAAPIDIGGAPLSDIIHVNYRSTFAGLQSGAFEDDILDALNFVLRIAAHFGQPVVINNSFGTNLGSHNGRMPFDQARNNLLDSFTGRSIVFAAGNDNNDEGFRSGKIAAGAIETFRMTPSDSGPDIWLELWYRGPGLDFKFDCNGDSTNWVNSPSGFTGRVDTYDIEVTRDTEPTGMDSIRLYIQSADDRWTVNFRNQGTEQAEYWAWTCVQGRHADLQGFSVDEHTLSDTCCARAILSVGSCAKRVGGNPELIADYSGCGPTIDGRIKPEIVAIGGTPATALNPNLDVESADSRGVGDYVGTQGTSMAAPLVAGAIALLFENEPTLNQDTIKALLTNTANTNGLNLDPSDPNYNSIHRNAYGYGRLRLEDAHLHTWPLVDVDVWVKTAADDFGVEPYIGGCMCHAPEVKVFDSGGTAITTLQWGQEHSVQVRIHNLGDHRALNTLVKLKYTRPHLNPDKWVPCQDASNDAIEQTVDVPPLSSILLTFDQLWKPESTEVPAVDVDWGDHYCLLVELTHPDDELVYNEGDSWTLNIKGHNNVALKNLHIQ